MGIHQVFRGYVPTGEEQELDTYPRQGWLRIGPEIGEDGDPHSDEGKNRNVGLTVLAAEKVFQSMPHPPFLVERTELVGFNGEVELGSHVHIANGLIFLSGDRTGLVELSPTRRV